MLLEGHQPANARSWVEGSADPEAGDGGAGWCSGCDPCDPCVTLGGFCPTCDKETVQALPLGVQRGDDWEVSLAEAGRRSSDGWMSSEILFPRLYNEGLDQVL